MRAIALTGTPVENRLGDLWSIYDFLDPGLLGSAREFSAFAKRLAERPDESYAPLRRLIQPYLLRRLKTDRSDRRRPARQDGGEGVLPALRPRRPRSIRRRSTSWRASSAGSTQGIERRGLVLAYLMRFKQICNHPAHWLGDGRLGRGGQRQARAPARDRRGGGGEAGEGARVHAVPRGHRAAGGVSGRRVRSSPGWCSTAARP